MLEHLILFKLLLLDLELIRHLQIVEQFGLDVSALAEEEAALELEVRLQAALVEIQLLDR
jgi:hypothetical protein